MKILRTHIIVLLLLFLLSGCNQEPFGNEGHSSFSINSPYASLDYLGMDKDEVTSVFQKAGFSNITFSSIDDINSKSEIPDGTVESVTIDGLSDFGPDDPFNKDSEIIISFHNIPKISLPLTKAEVKSEYYMNVGKTFHDVGFVNIITDELHDLSLEEEYRTSIMADGVEISNEAMLPFDSDISIIGHYPVSTYATTIEIDFESNWIFSKYDVSVAIGDRVLGTMKHGEDTIYNINLQSDLYDLTFSKADNSDIYGIVSLEINSVTTAKYHISCNSQNVKVEELEYKSSLETGSLLMPVNSDYFLRKNYQEAENYLKSIGFSNVVSEATTENLWGNDEICDVVGIKINDRTSFKYDDVFKKSDSVLIRYHVADFVFNDTELDVTERDVFNIDYTIASDDAVESIDFIISDPEIIKRNDDGSFTALSQGQAIVTACNGEYEYSTCNINVEKLIIPIEKLDFVKEEIEVSVGSTFDLGFKFVPEDANYIDMTVDRSNDFIEMGEDYSCYSNLPGDTEFTFYQDDRILGHCVVHATAIEIEDVVFDGTVNELYLGDTLSLKFKLSPDNATNKSIKVTSSDDRIVEVNFDERGQSVIEVVAKKAGDATISLQTPDGNKYTYDLTVSEIIPSEITINNKLSDKRIEVGDEIDLDVLWEPKDVSVKELSWESSNNKVIKIDSEGIIKAVGVGTATITAKHRSGVTGSIDIDVEPTLVTKIQATWNLENGTKLYIGSKFTILATIYPENATDQSLIFSSDNESVAKVSDRGVVTATGVGSAKIKVSSPDGPSSFVSVNVLPSPQKFRITWSASLVSNNHVGSSWSKGLYIDGDKFNSGNTITLDPDSSFNMVLRIEESDTNPDVGTYHEKIAYSDDLCKNGYSVSDTIIVYENSGRYSGYTAEWKISINITPVK
ncbi:MAG: Ig domain-containing protein [Erysipelotrichaceae bacterium]|nr:Ig domain-containing protein [Erysipelotrichaceae bacterium]